MVPRLVEAIFIIVCVSATTTLHAKSQALLIGIGQYPGLQALEGPVHDVALMEDILLRNDFYHEEYIEVLVNEKATKNNILHALDHLLKTTVRGDKVFLYFSGHGTSAFNTQIDANLPPQSGALVPYDIDSVSNKEELSQRLIIGKRDLQPVLSELDTIGAEVLVLVDACFSGNAVRGDDDARTLPVRFLEFPKLLQVRKKERLDKRTPLIQTDRYPYQNVYYLAAAQEDQTTLDIPEDKVSRFGTVDSKPHGVFTDSLVQTLLSFYERADEVKSTFTLADLHVATRRLMKKRGFLSTPNLLPDDPTRTNGITLYNFFGQSVSIDIPTEH